MCLANTYSVEIVLISHPYKLKSISTSHYLHFEPYNLFLSKKRWNYAISFKVCRSTLQTSIYHIIIFRISTLSSTSFLLQLFIRIRRFVYWEFVYLSKSHIWNKNFVIFPFLLFPRNTTPRGWCIISSSSNLSILSFPFNKDWGTFEVLLTAKPTQYQ